MHKDEPILKCAMHEVQMQFDAKQEQTKHINSQKLFLLLAHMPFYLLTNY
jgi:hypothetical protein